MSGFNLMSLFRKRPQGDAGPRFGYAVVGLGHIAGYFIDALASSPTCAVAALISGDAAKAQSLAAKRGIPHSGTYQDFEAVLSQPGVDAVYLALPVSLHREFTERAAAAGKHVLCEKPMAPTSADARAMIAACRAANVLLSIAYRCPHHARHRELRDLLRSGKLGALNALRIESGFGFALHPGWRDNPAQAGGGSLFDVGIYPLNTARFLLGENPVVVEYASAVCDTNGLERSIAWASIFPSGARAVCRSSYTEEIPDTLRVTGEGGSLLLAPAFSHRERYRLQGEYQDADGRHVINVRTPSNAISEFRLEAEQLAAAVHGTEPLLTPGEDGLADMVAMEAIYSSAGVPIGRRQRKPLSSPIQP
jgi:predicted dehydrogenase